jgi:hypothetical protein
MTQLIIDLAKVRGLHCRQSDEVTERLSFLTGTAEPYAKPSHLAFRLATTANSNVATLTWTSGPIYQGL